VIVSNDIRERSRASEQTGGEGQTTRRAHTRTRQTQHERHAQIAQKIRENLEDADRARENAQRIRAAADKDRAVARKERDIIRDLDS
jgi:hypothetical protein